MAVLAAVVVVVRTRLGMARAALAWPAHAPTPARLGVCQATPLLVALRASSLVGFMALVPAE